jgi:hypothetical protein
MLRKNTGWTDVLMEAAVVVDDVNGKYRAHTQVQNYSKCKLVAQCARSNRISPLHNSAHCNRSQSF